MRIKFGKTKAVVFVICFVVSYLIIVSADDARNIDKAITALKNGNDMMTKSHKFIEKHNPDKLFGKLGIVLEAVGPAVMAVSAILSETAVSFPQKEHKPELMAINAGFDKLNRLLEAITNRLHNFSNVVELSNAKSAYQKSVAAITHNYEALEDARNEKSTEFFDYFIKFYESSYDQATQNLYDALVGTQGQFGINLVTLYRDHFKCSPVLVSQYCIRRMLLIVKGLFLEGGYFGALNLNAITAKQQLWDVDMNTLVDTGSSTINGCEKDWKTSSALVFRESYNRDMSIDNQKFAVKIANTKDETVPQRSYLMVAYDDACVFHEHAHSSYYNADKICHEDHHAVNLFSIPEEEEITGKELKNITNLIDKQKRKAASINEFKTTEFWLIPKDRFGGNDSRTMVNIIREIFQRDVLYSIRNVKNPRVEIIGNPLYDS